MEKPQGNKDIALLQAAFMEDTHLAQLAASLQSSYSVSGLADEFTGCIRISDLWVTGRSHTIVQSHPEGHFMVVRFSILDHYEHRATTFFQEMALAIHDVVLATTYEHRTAVSKVLHSDTDSPVLFGSRFLFLDNTARATVELDLDDFLDTYLLDLASVTKAINLVNQIIIGGPK